MTSTGTRGTGIEGEDLDGLRIPTLPETLLRLDALLEDPEEDLNAIGDLVAADPPIAARVLRYANSAVYGQRKPVADLHHATKVLGTRVLRNLVLQAAVVGTFEHLRSRAELHVDALWRHSVTTAILCEQLLLPGSALAESLAPLDSQDLYACGLLHDVGRIVLLDAEPARYGEVLRLAREHHVPSHHLEPRMLHWSHPEVGALVAHRWNLPRIVADAIERHHEPWPRIASSRHVLVVVAADRLATSALTSTPLPPELREPRTWKFLQTDPATVPALLDLAREISSQVAV